MFVCVGRESHAPALFARQADRAAGIPTAPRVPLEIALDAEVNRESLRRLDSAHSPQNHAVSVLLNQLRRLVKIVVRIAEEAALRASDVDIVLALPLPG